MIKANSYKTSPSALRTCYDGDAVAAQHAELAVLSAYNATPRDTLYVVRFAHDGTLTMAKPCPMCQKAIETYGVGKVYYTNWEGDWVRL